MSNLNARIGVTGAKDVERDLKKIGQTGDQAFGKVADAARKASSATKDAVSADSAQAIRTAAERASAALAAVAKKATEVRSAIGGIGDGFRTARDGIAGVGSEIGRVVGAVKTATATVAGLGTAAATAVAGTVAKTAKEVSKLSKSARSLGESPETLSALQYAVNASGIDNETGAMELLSELSDKAMDYEVEYRESQQRLSDLRIEYVRAWQEYYQTVAKYRMSAATGWEVYDSQKKLTDILREAQSIKAGATDIQMAFNKFGVTPFDKDGKLKGNLQLLLEVSEAMQRLGPTEDVKGALMKLFGDELAEQAGSLIQDGPEKIKASMAEGRKLGVVIDQSLIEKSDAFNRQMTLIRATFEAIRLDVANRLLPTMTQLSGSAGGWLQANRGEIGAGIAGAFDWIVQKGQVAVGWLIRNKVEVRRFADAAADAFSRVATWAVAFDWTGFFNGLKESWETFGKPIFDTIVAGLQWIGKAAEPIFGRELSAGEVGLGLALIKLSGILTMASGAMTVLQGAFLVARGVILTAFTTMVAPIAAIVGWPLLIAGAVAAGLALVVANWDDIKATLSEGWAWFKGTFPETAAWAEKAAAGIVDVFGGLGNELMSFWNDVLDNGLLPAVSNVIPKILDLFASIGGWIADKVIEGFKIGLDAAMNSIDRIGSLISDGASQGWEAVKSSIFGMDKDTDSGTVLRRAGGGPVWGPGTSTSDSILARLSDGEFVVRTAAVRRYGLGFLHALNNMQLPTPGFRDGGHVVAAAAGGSSRTATRPVHVHFGDASYALNGSDDVVEALMTATAKSSRARVTSAPRWSRKG